MEFGINQIGILGGANYIITFSEASFFNIATDGKFKSSLNSFVQIYTIHGFIAGHSFPLIFCFINGKTERLYITMFEQI